MTVESDIERRAQARVGSVLRGKYRLDRLLGIGGMGAVFAATHQNNRNKVAIKMLHAELSVNAEIRARFLREGYIANTVEHPGVVRVIDDDTTEDGAVFLVLDLLEGETLATRLDAHGTLPAVEVTRIAIDLLEILSAAHEKGIVHRDVKPDNVFLTKKGEVRILDFGIARLREATGSASSTKSGHTVGTPAYMAPEQALGHTNKIGPACDVYSVGATMFTLLTGRYTHEAESVSELLVRAATQPVVSIGTLDRSLPQPLVTAIDKSLAFKLEDRWPSAADMREALKTSLGTLQSKVRAPLQSDEEIERAITEKPPPPPATSTPVSLDPTVAAPTPISLSNAAGLPPRRGPLPFVIGGAVVVCALIATTIMVGRHHDEPRAEAPAVSSAPVTVTTTPSPPMPEPKESAAPAPAASSPPPAVTAMATARRVAPKPSASVVLSPPPLVTPTATATAKPKVDPMDRQ